MLSTYKYPKYEYIKPPEQAEVVKANVIRQSSSA